MTLPSKKTLDWSKLEAFNFVDNKLNLSFNLLNTHAITPVRYLLLIYHRYFQKMNNFLGVKIAFHKTVNIFYDIITAD